MVLHHVAHRAGVVVVRAAPAFHAERLGDRDLHVVDVAVVEERLEDRVAEPEAQDVLDGLFPEVVIDAVELGLVEDRGDRGVQRPGALEAGAEGLLDDDARPHRIVASGDETGGRQLPDDDRKEIGRDRQVEEPVAGKAALAVDRLELLLQSGERRRVVVVGGKVMERAHQRVVGRRRRAALDVLRERARHRVAVGLVGHRRPREPDDRVALGHVAGRLELVERRNQLPPAQVARGAEDDDRDRIAGADELAVRGVGPRRGHPHGCSQCIWILHSHAPRSRFGAATCGARMMPRSVRPAQENAGAGSLLVPRAVSLVRSVGSRDAHRRRTH